MSLLIVNIKYSYYPHGALLAPQFSNFVEKKPSSIIFQLEFESNTYRSLGYITYLVHLFIYTLFNHSFSYFHL